MLARLSLITLRYSSVPQGSVLGPRAFIQYAEDVDDIFQSHGEHHHLFADDMQGHCSGRLDDVPALSLGLKAVLSISTPGAASNVYSSTPTKQSYCGLVRRCSCIGCHLRTIPSTSTSVSLSKRLSSENWACGSTPSYKCARTFLGWRRHFYRDA